MNMNINKHVFMFSKK